MNLIKLEQQWKLKAFKLILYIWLRYYSFMGFSHTQLLLIHLAINKSESIQKFSLLKPLYIVIIYEGPTAKTTHWWWLDQVQRTVFPFFVCIQGQTAQVQLNLLLDYSGNFLEKIAHESHYLLTQKSLVSSSYRRAWGSAPR